MFSSFASSLTSSIKSFASDVTSTVNAVLEDEKKEYQAEQERLERKRKEQEEKEKKRQRQAVPLWTIWKDEMRSIEPELQAKILKLSNDRRTFLAPAPDESGFKFNMDDAGPFATYALQLDLALERARFLLVPRKLSEETFWRNYFYRVENLRSIHKVESIFLIPEDEAQRRQRAMNAALAAAPLIALPAMKRPVGTSTSRASTAAGGKPSTGAAIPTDDDEEFNHDELNRYLNEELTDEDGDEPKIESTIQSATPVPSTAVTASSTAVPSSTESSTSLAAPTATKDAATLPVTSAPTPVPPPSSTSKQTDAKPAAPSSSVASSPSIPSHASNSTTSTGGSTVPASASAPSSVPKSTPAASSASSSAGTTTAAKSAIGSKSPLDDNDEEDLAELESMLHEVEHAGAATNTQDETELDEQQLAELENELDM